MKRFTLILAITLATSLPQFLPSTPARASAPGLDGVLAAEYAAGVYLVDPVDGLSNLAKNYVAHGDSPVWSPSGDLLAMNDGSTLVTIRPNGTDRKPVSQDCIDGRPTWNPDGTKIAYRSCSGISITELATGQTTSISIAWVGWLAWSPDGEWIAMSKRTLEDDDWDLWKIRPDGTDLTQIIDRPGNQLGATWSPDGTQIAFEDWVPQDDSDIALVGANGGAVTTLTPNTESDAHPSWSPSGDRIAFNSSREGGGIFTMAADGSDVRKVPTGPYQLGGPEWQPVQVAVSATRDVVDSGDRVRLDIQIADPGTSETTVTLERRVIGVTGWAVFDSLDVDPSGAATTSVPVKLHTEFRAIWAGDSTFIGGASLAVLVKARAVVTGHLYREYKTSGKWHLYHSGRKVWYTAKVEPNLRGERLCFRLDHLVGAKWKEVFRDCYGIDRNGTAGIYVYNIPDFERGRLRAEFSGLKNLLADVAPWSYFRMTR